MRTSDWIIVAIALTSLALSAAAVLITRRRRAERRLSPGKDRILFPFSGERISREALDAAIRLARAESATLVPAYLARVPLSIPLDSAIPVQAQVALQLLEIVEQRASRAGVAVDSRIERGRTPRHALERVLAEERYGRIVAVARSEETDGFDPDDVAWLLEHAGGEVLVLRPDHDEPLQFGDAVLGSLG